MAKDYASKAPREHVPSPPPLLAEDTCIICKKRRADAEGTCEVCAAALAS